MATRMQQRRGTAQQWTDADPILAAGEIGFETDTSQFKIGDGVNAWSVLSYFKNLEDLGGTLDDYVPLTQKGASNGVATLDGSGKIPSSQIPDLVGLDTEISAAVSTAVANLVDGAPAALNTLNEIATVLGDSSNITGNIINNLAQMDTTLNELGTDVNNIGTTVTSLQSTVSSHTTSIASHGQSIQTQGSDLETLTASVIAHTEDTTNIHGIADTSLLATKAYAEDKASQAQSAAETNAASTADTKIAAHSADTTSVHGIADTSLLATKSYADNAVSDHTLDTTSVHGIADTAALATKTYADNAADTAASTAVAALTKSSVGLGNVDNTSDANKPVSTATQTALDAKAPIASPTFTGTVSGITKSMVGLGNVDNTSDANKPVSTATQTALDLKAPKAGPTFTGTLTAADVTISGNLTVNGTTTTVSSTNLEVTDPLIYIGTGNSANSKDLGVVGHFNDGTYQHTGLTRDASDGKWKLFSGVTTEPSDTIDFTTWTKDTLVLGSLEATTVTPSSGVVFSDGTQTKEGVPSRTPIQQKTASYTLSSLTERDNLIEVSSTSATTITIPTNATLALPVGTSIDILQTNTGQVTIAGAAGVTVNATPGLKLRTQWSGATLFKRATDTWVVTGDLSA